jgi:hypothetical protein
MQDEPGEKKESDLAEEFLKEHELCLFAPIIFNNATTGSVHVKFFKQGLKGKKDTKFQQNKVRTGQSYHVLLVPFFDP